METFMRKIVIRFSETSSSNASVFFEGTAGVLRKQLYSYIKKTKNVDGKSWLEDKGVTIKVEREPHDRTWIVGLNFNMVKVTPELTTLFNGFAKSIEQKAQWSK
jgi:hypothetical protein